MADLLIDPTIFGIGRSADSGAASTFTEVEPNVRIVGHGIDIVEVEKTARLLFGPGCVDVIGDWFTEEELAGAPSGDPSRSVYLSGQIAAKEAIVKALGTGLIGDMNWSEIEVLRDESGAPRVVLTGAVEATAAALNVSQWFVSITHTDTYAVASAIAVVL